MDTLSLLIYTLSFERNQPDCSEYPDHPESMSEVLAINKKAKFDYQITDTFLAGMKLTGPEVKSVKTGGMQLKGAYITLNSRGELSLVGAHIRPYLPAGGQQKDYDVGRERKLLLHKREIDKLRGARESGYTIVPMRVFDKNGWLKVEIGLGKAKKKHDKRADLKARDWKRKKQQLEA